MANCLFLWTELGTARHCQMLNDTNARAIFDALKTGYFAVNKPALVPQVFNHPHFGNLRIVIINGEVWFVGKDVAEGLGYKDTFAALKQHVDPADKLNWQITSAGQKREVTVINKSGVYSLILDSQMPKAKEYRHWVTSEILPQVDEKGYYVKESAQHVAEQPDFERAQFLAQFVPLLPPNSDDAAALVKEIVKLTLGRNIF